MKNYIVTFTNDAIKYDMERQQEAIKQELNGDDNYFSKINEEITFEQIDREVESAIYHNYDNFVCLAEDEDIDMLQDGLNAEYGNQFNEILVIPEAFGRLDEADMNNSQPAANAPQAANQPAQQNNSDPNNIGKQLLAILQGLESQKLLVPKGVKTPDGDTNHWIMFDCIKPSGDTVSKLKNESLVKFGFLIYCMNIAANQKQEKEGFYIKLLNSTTYKVSFKEPANAEVCQKLENLEMFFNPNCQEKVSAARINGTQYKFVNVSAKGEEKVSSASTIHVIAYNLSYPFLRLMVPSFQAISSLTQASIGNNSDVLYMAAGPIPGQQFLSSSNMLGIAISVPYQGENLDATFKKVMPPDSVFQCGTPTPESVVSSLQTNLKTLAPGCRELILHIPSTMQGLTSIEPALSKIYGNAKVIVEESLPVFDAAKNTETFRAVEELIMNKENGFKKCKSTKGAEIFKDQEKTNQEITKEIQGKDAEDVEKMAKEAAGDNSAIMQEIESGWPAFVKSLIEATIQFKENPTEANKDKAQFDREKSQFVNLVLEPFKKDLQSFDAAIMATGFGAMAKVLYKAGKEFMKSGPKQDPKTQKMVEENKTLIMTDAYAIIKTNFGGVDTSDKIAKDIKDAQTAETIEKAAGANESLKKEGVTKD